MFTTYLQNKIKNEFLQKKLLRCFKTFKTKKVLKIFNFFFFTVYRMRHAIVGGNFTPIGEYSSTVKNRQKWVTLLINSCLSTYVPRKNILKENQITIYCISLLNQYSFAWHIAQSPAWQDRLITFVAHRADDRSFICVAHGADITHSSVLLTGRNITHLSVWYTGRSITRSSV
jgi:hypothetical protein